MPITHVRPGGLVLCLPSPGWPSRASAAAWHASVQSLFLDDNVCRSAPLPGPLLAHSPRVKGSDFFSFCEKSAAQKRRLGG